ncbi:MAG TPA: hypothetical protein VFI37_02315 [Gaiellaceae bacterium]|nr:hypothetical protein [Gaiellaceae bacterium]
MWEFYALRFALLTEAEPNAGHRAIAELEGAGLVALLPGRRAPPAARC